MDGDYITVAHDNFKDRGGRFTVHITSVDYVVFAEEAKASVPKK